MKILLTSLLALAATAPLAFAALVSPPAQPAVSAGGNSFNPVFSADGQKLVFVSHANNLVTNDDHGLWLDVFVRDLVTSNTVLVSVSMNGTGGANADANYPSVSADGRYIAFSSYASNLVPGATNGRPNIFVRDTVLGATRVATVDTNGLPADGLSGSLISSDGRYVFFASSASMLTADSVGLSEFYLYRRDLWSNLTVRASVSTGGGAQFSRPELGGITPDGAFSAYSSRTNSSANTDAFRYQVGSSMTWLSVSVAGLVSGTYRCSPPVLSEDGRYAAFHVTPDSGNSLVVRHDAQAGTTAVLSQAATNLSHGLSISADGRFVLYEEMDGVFSRVRLWDAQLNSSALLASGCDDARGNPAMNAAGTAFTFVGCSNIFAHGTNTLGVAVRASVSTNGGASSGSYQFSTPVIRFDGALVAFATTANDLAPGDLNGQSDIYLRDVNTGVTELITKAAPSKPVSTAFAHSFLGPNSISADGRFIVSTRYDDPSVFRDTNGLLDVFVSDKLLGTTHALSLDTNLYFIQGGGGPGYFTNAENTNYFYGPILSADGSAVVTLSRLSANIQVMWVNGTNGVFGSRFRVVNHTGSSGVGSFGNGDCSSPSISSNGWSVVFTTTASDYTYENATLDNNNATDVVLRRIADASMTGTNYLVSVAGNGMSGGGPWGGASSNGIISPDGRWVIFESMASNLTPEATDSLLNLYARDLWSNVTHQISQPVSVSPVMRFTGGTASFSPDSKRVAYWVQQASGEPSYAVVHDLLARTNVTVDTHFPGTPGTTKPSTSAGGRHVAYRARFGNFNEIRVRDRVTGQTDVLDSRSVASALDDNPLIGSDGRYVVYRAKFPTYNYHTNQILVRDRLLGTTLIASASAQGGTGNGPSTKPVLAASGRTVVFQSFASDLVAGDFNDMRDLFVLTLGGVDSEPDGMDDDWEVAFFNNLSHDGTADSDGDGATDLQEFLAGTDPTNANSVFRVLTIAPASGGARTLLWSGNATRSYRAEFKDDLATATWTALTGTISWNGTTASLPDPTAGSATNRYYRVLRLP